MNVQLTLIILAAIANLALGVAVLVRNSRGEVHRYFALFSLAVASWTLSNGLVSTFADADTGYVWARLAFVAAAVIPLAFLLFASVFPVADPPPSRPVLRFLVWTGILASLSSSTPLMVRGTASVAGKLHILYGPLHRPYGLYFVLCFGYSLLLLTRKLLHLKGVKKLQVRYLFFAVFTSAVGATFTNLIIPIVFETSEFSKYGPLFGILMVALIAHAIIRHRLLDMRVVIRQGAVYVCAIAVSASVFFVLAELFHLATGYREATIPVVEALVLAVLVGILFQPLKQRIQDSMNRYVYRETYDYQRTIREASRRLSTLLDLQPLVDYLADLIDRTLRVETVLVYLTDQSERTLTLRLPKKDPDSVARTAPLTLAFGSPLVRFVQSTQQMVVREDASREPMNAKLETAAQQLAELSGDLAFPLFQQQTVIGIVVVGAKRSGDPFFVDDLDLLSTLTGQAAIAMKNAQLYQQVVLANEYVENILRTMESGVITVNADGHVALCNSTAVRLTGLSRERLSTLAIDSLPMPLGSQLRDTLADGRPRPQVETALPSDADRWIPLVCSTSALRDDRGNILGALIVFSDLSKIKELENEKRRAERLASLGFLVSGIAHEIKNPLVAIKTFAELLPERFSDTDFRDDFSKVVKTEIDRIDGLVGRLRGLAAPTPNILAPIDLREPVSDTLSLLRAQLEHTHTAVDRDLGSSQALVAIDPSQAKQLFLNLFLNALEAMTPGGRLTVRILRSHRQGQPWIQVAISDTGQGIPDAIRAKIFEPFFSTKTRGSGLGLAICRSITDAHRGTMRIETVVPGVGTTIVVEFPMATVQAQIEEQSTVLR